MRRSKGTKPSSGSMPPLHQGGDGGRLGDGGDDGDDCDGDAAAGAKASGISAADRQAQLLWQFAKTLNNRMKSTVHKTSILHSANFSSCNGILSMHKPQRCD